MTDREVKKIEDNCPKWAEEMIDLLRKMEISLGNIPASENWRSQHVKDVQASVVDGEGSVFTESQTEQLFEKITQGLFEEKFSIEDIAKFLNIRITYEGGPQYCSLKEVEDSVK